MVGTMKMYPRLYKRTSNGTIQQWQIFVDDNSYHTVEGLVDGKLTTSKATFVKGKNAGKANATTDHEQACKDAQSKHTKKLEKGYTLNIEDIDDDKKFFEPMLAKKYVDYKDDIQFPCLVSRKLDGSRLIASKKGLYTRNGKMYVSCPHISDVLKPLFDKHLTWVVDSEIYSHDVPFEKIMSLVRKSKPTQEDIIESSKIVKIYIFDGVIDDVNADFVTRFETIQSEINQLIGKSKYLVFVKNHEVNSDAEIMEYHDKFVEEGYEGAMIRIPSAPYENKRSKYLLKYKNFMDEEFEIVDILEGIGNRANMAGKIVVQLHKPTTDGKTTCESGIRGGEDYYRDLLKHRTKLIGKKATIRFQGYTEKNSLRFPVSINIDPLDR